MYSLSCNEARREKRSPRAFYLPGSGKGALNMAMNQKKDMVPVEEVAQELGTTGLNVMMHIKRRLLEGREIEGQWYVSMESLEQYRLEGADRPGSTLCSRHCPSNCGSCA
jgi:hypothetical protein